MVGRIVPMDGTNGIVVRWQFHTDLGDTCIQMFIWAGISWAGISSIIWSEISFYGDA